ncbi:MAG: nitroreductase family protein [Phycisphaerae bacterium]|nr:nitroreductase family protein [Phycisphaerae bacterium]
MDLSDAINHRRSVQSYTQQEVTDEKIRILLEAAIRAPSAGNRQTWRFVVVKDTHA